MSKQQRYAVTRRKLIAQLMNLIGCVEFYYNTRSKWTHSELDELEDSVQMLKVKIAN
jgi:hypothetical protein